MGVVCSGFLVVLLVVFLVVLCCFVAVTSTYVLAGGTIIDEVSRFAPSLPPFSYIRRVLLVLLCFIRLNGLVVGVIRRRGGGGPTNGSLESMACF